jgi:phosphoribosylglycinamide formyltransferase-1
MSTLRVVFLASGGGGSLKFVHLAAQQLGLPIEVVAVLTDRNCGALAYARQACLPGQQLTYTRKAPEALQQALRQAAPDLVVTNIHKIIDPETLLLLPGRFINLHYSLLPAFKGLIGMETLVQAKSLNVTVVGATCHTVEEEVDAGRCIVQFGVGADWERDTLQDMQELVFRGACLALLQGIMQQSKSIESSSGANPLGSLSGRPVLFAPALSFDAGKLDEEFWRLVKQA